MKIISITLLIASVLIITNSSATSPFPEEKKPSARTLDQAGVYILDGISALSIIKRCGIENRDLMRYWNPTEQQIELIDKKLNSELEKKGFKIDPLETHKQYVAAETTDGEEFVYALIYPSQKKSVYFELENTAVICNREDKLSIRVEFDLQTFEFTFFDQVVIPPKKQDKK